MVALSLALVATATVFLAAGLVADGALAPIALSILCSAAAALVLAAWWRRVRVTSG